jgi:hypothetical protein
MNAAEITALCTGLPAIIGTITALVIALRGKQANTATAETLAEHIKAHP